MGKEEQIADVIIKRASTTAHVVGAQLGYSVRQAFPSVNMKMEYGGIQAFIKRYCQGKVFCIGKSGPDDVYTTTPPPANGASTPNSATDHTGTTFWQAFSNPEKGFLPAVNPANGSLTTVSHSQPLPLGYVEVPKLTDDEHRSFAKEFLLFVDYKDRVILEPILAKEKFWPEWATRITSLEVGRYRAKWLAFRFQRIINTLESRLAALKIADASRAGILEKVKETKDPRRNAERAESLARVESNTAVSQTAGNVSELRQLAHKAIDSMGEDELRRLWVPLGALGDVLKHK